METLQNTGAVRPKANKRNTNQETNVSGYNIFLIIVYYVNIL